MAAAQPVTSTQDLIHQLQTTAAQVLRQQYPEPLANLQPTDLQVTPTAEGHRGDFTLVLFPLLKHRLGKPEAIGEKLAEALLPALPMFTDWEVVKGFLNLAVDPAWWVAQAQAALAAGPTYQATHHGQGTKVMVEFSSPNTNKPLHLGHLRNNFLGDAVCRILAAAGYSVVRANLINDRGIHICKSMLAWQRYGQGETPEGSHQKGDHLVGRYYVRFEQELRAQAQEVLEGWHANPNQAPDPVPTLLEKRAAETNPEKQAELDAKLKDLSRNAAPLMADARAMLAAWEAGDPTVVDLWRMMNAWVLQGFRTTYDRLGIGFDQWYYESETYLKGKALVEEGLQQGVFFRKDDGSVWADLSADGLDEKLVLRADGTAVYMTQDLGTAQMKVDDHGLDRSIYVIGNEQDYHMAVLKLLLQKLGKPWADGLYHLSYGMVELPHGRMKSREGTVVDADDLLDEMHRTAAHITQELGGRILEFDEAEREALFEAIGQGALKFYLLKVDPKKKLVFNPEESVDFKGHTGPFIQYTHARLNSLLDKATDAGEPLNQLDAAHIPDAEELAVLKTLLDWPRVLNAAADAYDPARLALWVYELARAYNRFYHDHKVLTAEGPAKAFRLGLSKLTKDLLAKGLELLGIVAPARM